MASAQSPVAANVARVAILVGFLAAIFGSAGTLNWPRAWIFLGLAVLEGVFLGAYLNRKNPELRKHRRAVGAGTKSWDRAWLVVFWVLLAVIPLVAGLTTVRAGVAPSGWGWWALGFCCFVAGVALSARSMAENPHFEGTVRIQTERNHKVISTGPYAVIRHPGYLGLALFVFAMPLLFGSRQAEWAGLAGIVWLIVRTIAEDRTLQRELPGYAEYAQRVRWRLVPWVW